MLRVIYGQYIFKSPENILIVYSYRAKTFHMQSVSNSAEQKRLENLRTFIYVVLFFSFFGSRVLIEQEEEEEEFVRNVQNNKAQACDERNTSR